MPRQHQSYEQSDAYKTYAAFTARPDNLPIWPKDAQGQYIIKTGELYCRYGVNGKMCKATKRFGKYWNLRAHVRNQHGSSMIAASVRGWKSASQTNALIAFYTNLLATIGVTLVVAAPEDIPESAPEPDGSVTSDILDGESINPNEAEAEAEDEDEEDIDSFTGIPSLEGRAPETPAWKKTTAESRDNTLALIIQTAQRGGGKNRLG